MRHTLEPRLVLENTLNHLRVGGEAYIGFSNTVFLQKNPQIFNILEQQEVTIEPIARYVYMFRRTTKKKIRIPEV